MEERFATIEEQVGNIREEIGRLTEWRDSHELENKKRFEMLQKNIDALPDKNALALLATREDIASLATRESVEEVLRVFNVISTTLRMTSTGGKWGYRIILGLAAFIAALSVITGAWKGMLATLIHALTNRI